MKTENLIKLGRFLTVLCFSIGTIILGLYYATLAKDWAFVGFFFCYAAVLVNGFFLIVLLIRAIIDVAARRMLLFTSGLMLINIPIALLCFYLGGSMADILRITLRNNTETVVTNVRMNGCKTNEFIKILQPGEKQTISIKIPGDCALYVDYLQNGKKKRETVQDYVTNEGGAWIDYNIGGPKEAFQSSLH